MEGWTVDSRSGRAISFARVSLTDSAGKEIARTLSDSSGFFRLRPGEPGTYLLYAEAPGFLSGIEGPLELASTDTLLVGYSLQPAPIQLDSLTISVDPRSSRLQEVGFFRRAQAGREIRLDRRAIEQRLEARDIRDLLVGIPGVSITNEGVSLRGMSTLLGRAHRGFRWMRILVSAEGWEKAVHPMHIEGLEIFRRPSEAPAQYAGAQSGCGVVLIWTRTGR